jgi:hypothetical protein
MAKFYGSASDLTVADIGMASVVKRANHRYIADPCLKKCLLSYTCAKPSRRQVWPDEELVRTYARTISGETRARLRNPGRTQARAHGAVMAKRRGCHCGRCRCCAAHRVSAAQLCLALTGRGAVLKPPSALSFFYQARVNSRESLRIPTGARSRGYGRSARMRAQRANASLLAD